MNFQQSVGPDDVSLRNFKLEPHVEQALTLAESLALGNEVCAADLIRSALILSESETSSDAFKKLRELFARVELPMRPPGVKAGLDLLQTMSYTPGLDRSLGAAADFIRNGVVWGRDYIALALLAREDPSLTDIAYEAGFTVRELQDAWFEYVTAQDVPRGRDVWIQWWRTSDTPIPINRSLPAYLLTWNADRNTQFIGLIEQAARQIEGAGTYILKWGTGNRQSAAVGSRVFLLRQGSNAPGLIGSGVIEGEIEDNPQATSSGSPARMATVRWDRMSLMPIIPRDNLVHLTNETALWNTRAGGVEIPNDILGKIESAWDVGEALRFAQTLSDLDHKNDWIGIRKDVEALSTLVAVKQVEPPLSIAIFGDWGSGKTFLMRKIQERVKVLEVMSQGQITAADEKIRYCNSILQIEFNAWHYTESNLWASLVNEIFAKLHEKLRSKEADEKDEQKINRLIRQFQIARQARQAAENKIAPIAAEVERAEQKLVAEKDNVKEKRQSLAKALGKNIWTELDAFLTPKKQDSTDTQKGETDPQADSSPTEGDAIASGIGSEDKSERRIPDEVKNEVIQSDFMLQAEKQRAAKQEDLTKALKHFGFQEALESAQSTYETVKRFRTVSGRAGEVFGSLLATPRGVAGAVVLAVVVLLMTYISLTLDLSALSISTGIAGALIWLAERAGSARKWLDKIQSYDEWFSKVKQDYEQQIAAEVAAAQAEYDQQQEARTLAEKQLADAEARVVNARAELENLTVRDQMRRFVDQRVTEQTYSKHLGIISMIRQDFEDLSDFMYRSQQKGEARLEARIREELRREINKETINNANLPVTEDKDKKEKELIEQHTKEVDAQVQKQLQDTLDGIPTVERIILYIDDLDRCQPERVVEVLEAIHLLLAFRLFVVVVAVDPRWVITSLKRKYPHLARQNSFHRNQPAGAYQDLQLEPTAHDYLEKIFNIPFWVKPMGPNASRSLIAGFFNMQETGEADQANEDRFDSIQMDPTARGSSIPDFNPTDDNEVQTGEGGSETRQRLEKEQQAALRSVQNVSISEAEQQFIRKLSGFLGSSPRRIKRYANTYRLLKAGLTKSEARVFGSVENSNEDFMIVLVFLAIVTGAPTLAQDVFLKVFEQRDNFKVDDLLSQLGLEGDTGLSKEAANVKGALSLLKDLDISKEEIETWVPRVMRYAFRLTPVNLIGMSPGKTN